MTKTNVRGMLYSLLIGGLMVAGVLLTAPHAKATPEQDYMYYSLLENNGLRVTSPVQAKNTATIICNMLSSGDDWRLILTQMMTGADWDVDTATTVFAAAVTVYCPDLKPNFDSGDIT